MTINVLVGNRLHLYSCFLIPNSRPSSFPFQNLDGKHAATPLVNGEAADEYPVKE